MPRSRPVFVTVAVAAATVAAAVPFPASVVERVYARWFYAHLQPAVTGVSNLLPIAFLDLAVAAVLSGAVFVYVRRRMRRGRPGGACPGEARVEEGRRHPGRMLGRAAGILAFAALVVYVWFVVFWGFNYRRLPLEVKLAYDPSRVTSEAALTFGRLAVAHLNQLADVPPASPGEDEALAGALAAVERALGATRPARTATPKRSLLGWYFRQAAIDGMTDPFFLEIILNPDLLPSERPFVLAHEWAHLAGYADESEANFVAWLACVRGTPAAQYSGWLAAYQHVAAGLPRGEREALRAALPPRAAADLQASRRRFARSSETVRRAARDAYDTYLRANRVEEGIASYGAVVRLMLGTQFGDGWTPRLRQ